jgi:hypothetical protein
MPTLWLPILISTAALFFASFLSWMVLRLHEKDWHKMPDEDRIIDAIRESSVPDGNYMFPGTESMREMNDPEYVAVQMAGRMGFRLIYVAWTG